MTQVINAILQPFLTIIHFVMNLATGLIQLFQSVVQSIRFFDQALGSLPPVLYAIALCFISVAVIHVVIGR